MECSLYWGWRVIGGWKQERRVVAKAEHIDGKENPRFVVTFAQPASRGGPSAV
jgi:hypothetical protein